MTGPSLHNRVSISDKDRESPHITAKTVLGPMHLLHRRLEHSSSGCAFNHSPPPFAEANNTWNSISMPPTASLDAGLTNAYIYIYIPRYYGHVDSNRRPSSLTFEWTNKLRTYRTRNGMYIYITLVEVQKNPLFRRRYTYTRGHIAEHSNVYLHELQNSNYGSASRIRRLNSSNIKTRQWTSSISHFYTHTIFTNHPPKSFVFIAGIFQMFPKAITYILAGNRLKYQWTCLTIPTSSYSNPWHWSLLTHSVQWYCDHDYTENAGNQLECKDRFCGAVPTETLGRQTRRQYQQTQLVLFVIQPTRWTNFTNLFCHETLHVSDSSSVHHSLFTVHSAMVYVTQVCRQLSSRTRMELQFHSGPAARKLSTNLYDIYHCWLYSE